MNPKGEWKVGGAKKRRHSEKHEESKYTLIVLLVLVLVMELEGFD